MLTQCFVSASFEGMDFLEFGFFFGSCSFPWRISKLLQERLEHFGLHPAGAPACWCDLKQTFPLVSKLAQQTKPFLKFPFHSFNSMNFSESGSAAAVVSVWESGAMNVLSSCAPRRFSIRDKRRFASAETDFCLRLGSIRETQETLWESAFLGWRKKEFLQKSFLWTIYLSFKDIVSESAWTARNLWDVWRSEHSKYWGCRKTFGAYNCAISRIASRSRRQRRRLFVTWGFESAFWSSECLWGLPSSSPPRICFGFTNPGSVHKSFQSYSRCKWQQMQSFQSFGSSAFDLSQQSAIQNAKGASAAHRWGCGALISTAWFLQ